MPEAPSQEEVLAYFDTLSNWGRWGDDDTLGTLNLITDAKRRQAASLVHEGVSISCSRLIPWGGQQLGGGNPVIDMAQSGERYALGDNPEDPAMPGVEPLQWAGERLSFAFHGQHLHAHRRPRARLLRRAHVQRPLGRPRQDLGGRARADVRGDARRHHDARRAARRRPRARPGPAADGARRLPGRPRGGRAGAGRARRGGRRGAVAHRLRRAARGRDPRGHGAAARALGLPRSDAALAARARRGGDRLPT